MISVRYIDVKNFLNTDWQRIARLYPLNHYVAVCSSYEYSSLIICEIWCFEYNMLILFSINSYFETETIINIWTQFVLYYTVQ